MGFVFKHATLLVFCTAMVFALASLGLLWLKEGPLAFAAVAVSVLFSVGSIWMSEHRGFVRTRQMRRAFEPARNFNGIQVLLLVALMMIQVGLVSYFLIT